MGDLALYGLGVLIVCCYAVVKLDEWFTRWQHRTGRCTICKDRLRRRRER